VHRAKGTQHPLQMRYKIDVVPLAHEKIDEWRDALRRGVAYHHEDTNFRVTGGIDDVWVRPNGELIVVDYKATSKKDEVNLDAEWQIGYKRQMEVYQWLFRKNGFQVSDVGYFVYCNGIAMQRLLTESLNSISASFHILETILGLNQLSCRFMPV